MHLEVLNERSGSLASRGIYVATSDIFRGHLKVFTLRASKANSPLCDLPKCTHVKKVVPVSFILTAKVQMIFEKIFDRFVHFNLMSIGDFHSHIMEEQVGVQDGDFVLLVFIHVVELIVSEEEFRGIMQISFNSGRGENLLSRVFCMVIEFIIHPRGD